MLVVTRRMYETVQVGDAIIQIVGQKGGKFRIGITAPPEVQVVREDAKHLEPRRPRRLAAPVGNGDSPQGA